MTDLRIGCVKYLNARPLIYGWPGHVTFDHPAALCDQLQHGLLQIALVSSFEFLRNPIYRVVDSVSVACDGPVYSVVVAYKGEFSELEEIVLDPASRTSVALLRCLLAKLDLHPDFIADTDKSSNKRRGMLLIGDQAIRFRQKHARDLKFWDLGEAWKQMTDLPFVFALWLVRPEVSDAKAIADKLRQLCDTNLRNLDPLIAQEGEFDRALCSFYFRDHLRFGFGERERQALQTFAASCADHGLISPHELVPNLI